MTGLTAVTAQKTKKSSKVLDDDIYRSFRSPFVIGKTVCKKICSGGRTRTSGLRVMSPTSYQLLYPAMWNAKVRNIFETANFYFKNSAIPSMSCLSNDFWTPLDRFLTWMMPLSISFPPFMDRKGMALRSA